MELTKTPSFSLNQSRTEGIIGSPAHKMCSRFHMPDLTQGQSGQQPESRHLDVPWIRKQWVSCFPSWGFMFSHSGFHVFPRRVSCFPLLCDRSGVSCFPVTTGFMFSPHNGFHVFPRRVSCFPIWGFMFSLVGFHVFPLMIQPLREARCRPH